MIPVSRFSSRHHPGSVARDMAADVNSLTERQAIAWIREGQRVIQALVVDVRGSAPLPPGAMMIIGEHGEIEGSITGGCVEGAIAEEAATLLAGSRHARVLSYAISDELAGSVGLSCGGVVDVFLAELSGASGVIEAAALQAHQEGRAAAVATLLDGDNAGARMAVIDGLITGSLAGPSLLNRNVGREMVGLLDEGKTTLRLFGTDGETLGDALRVHVRSFATPRRMVIVGAVDFAAALASMAARVGYEVTICDARPQFARSSRFAANAQVVVGWPQDILPDIALGPRDAMLVFTHDRKFDEPALIAAMASDAGYIGALGSRRTAADRERRLRTAGVSAHELKRLHSPCGLDIGSSTAEETAVSVLAEIIATRTARVGGSLRAGGGPIHGETPPLDQP